MPPSCLCLGGSGTLALRTLCLRALRTAEPVRSVPIVALALGAYSGGLLLPEIFRNPFVAALTPVRSYLYAVTLNVPGPSSSEFAIAV